MALLQSSPPDASATVRGLVGLLAQTFAGAKTFAATLIASAGIQLSALWNTNGTGASDVAVKVGVSTADSSVAGSARLLSIRSGIGGTETEYAYFVKGGMEVIGGVVSGATNTLALSSAKGTGASDIVTKLGTAIPDASVNDAATLLSVRTGIGGTEVEKVAINKHGRVDQPGTDSSGSPGAATINKPTGKSAIASGSATVVITNSLVAAGDQVHITWHGDHGQIRDWVTTAAGSFTVSLNAAASADAAFCWTVAKRL